MSTLTQKLDDARTAYHQLMTGRSPRVFVDQNGERVEYVMANADRLRSYIQRLEAEEKATSVQGPCGPMRPFF